MGHTVLVVDADADVRRVCRASLELAGHAVLEAGDAEQGLRLLRDRRPDVALLDVALQVDGTTLLAAVGQDPEVAAVARVALADEHHGLGPVEAWRLGAAEYLAKPFSPLALVQLLEDLSATPSTERRRAWGDGLLGGR